MSKHFTQLQELLETRQEYEELKDLADVCFKIFESYIGTTMNYFEECVTNEWPKLCSKVHEYFGNVEYALHRLKEGILNREEFQKEVQGIVDKTNEKLAKLKAKLDKAEEDFLQEYNSFFSTDSTKRQKGASKYIYFVLSQPEVRDIIMKFLEN
jgi:BMFP domain-containing protein YqiC